MNQETTNPNTDLPTTGRKVELLHALNAATVSLHQSAHSKTEVFHTFVERSPAARMEA